MRSLFELNCLGNKPYANITRFFLTDRPLSELHDAYRKFFRESEKDSMDPNYRVGEYGLKRVLETDESDGTPTWYESSIEFLPSRKLGISPSEKLEVRDRHMTALSHFLLNRGFSLQELI